MEVETVPGLPNLHVLSSTGGETVAVLHNLRPDCSTCGRATRKGARLSVTLQDLPRGWSPASVKVYFQRFECKAKHEQAHPLVTAGIRASVGGIDLLITQRLFDALLDRYLRGQSVPSLAIWSGVAPASLWQYFSAALDASLSNSRDTRTWGELTHIGIDEIFWERTELGVVVDLKTSRLIDLLPDREESLEDCLRELKQVVEDEQRRGQPRPSGLSGPTLTWRPVIVTDMWDAFRQVARKVFGPDVILVVDRFHLVAKASEDLQSAAQALLPADLWRPAKLRQLRADYLRGLKTQDIRCTLQASKAELVQLTHLLQLANDLHDIWRADDVQKASELMDNWTFRVLDTSPIGMHRPFSRLAYLLTDWRQEVLNYHHPEAAMGHGNRSKPTNAQTERVNGTLRRLLQQSRATRQLGPLWSRRTEAQDLRYQAQELHLQRQFHQFYVRAMHTVNVSKRPRQVLVVHPSPDKPQACRCGTPSEGLQVKASSRGSWDLPLGDHPVRIKGLRMTARCPDCGTEQCTGVTEIMTDRLRTALTAQAGSGRPLGRLSRESGVSTDALRKHLLLPEVNERPAGEWIGLLSWSWHRRPYWLVTDARSGQPLQLMPGEFSAITEYLTSEAGASARRVLVSNPAWGQQLPSGVEPVVDAFSAIHLVQPALKEVLWRFTEQLTIEQRRAPEFERHRRLILENPLTGSSPEGRSETVDTLARRERILDGDWILKTAYGRIQAFRAVLSRDVETIAEAEEYLRAWQVELRLDAADRFSQDRRIKSAHYAFFNVCREVQQHQQAVARGMVARTTNRMSLASSKRRYQDLRVLEAARGFDFETLRRAVLAPMGNDG